MATDNKTIKPHSTGQFILLFNGNRWPSISVSNNKPGPISYNQSLLQLYSTLVQSQNHIEEKSSIKSGDLQEKDF